MSDVGLSSNIYNISNKYLELFNRFLVEVNYNPNDISTDHINSIKAILRKLSDSNSKNFQVQLVHNIFENYLKLKKLDTQLILNELLNSFDDNTYQEPKSIKKIEMLAAALDKECDHAFSRIQKR